jgi:hypothetical protein
MYVTSDFQLLPASAMSYADQVAADIWDFNNGKGGHLLELIPRPGGFRVTVRYDNGTKVSKLFTEFSNGKPFPEIPPGNHGWAYTLSDEEVQTAMKYYGQEMSVGEFLELVAPGELDIMDDVMRLTVYHTAYYWSDPNEPGSPWTIQVTRGGGETTYNVADEDNLLPDLSAVPVGRETKSGPGWEMEIVVEDLNQYSSMAGYYKVQYPDIWNSLSPAKQKELELEPARVGYITMSRTLNPQQIEIVRGLWGSTMTNAEYFSTVWPDLWAAMPAWEKNSEFCQQIHQWLEPDMSQDFIPEDYVEHSVTNPVATVKAGAPVTFISNNTVNVLGIKKGGSSGVQSQSVARNNLTSGSSFLTIYSIPKENTNNINLLLNSLLPQTKPSQIIAKPLPTQGKTSGVSRFALYVK